MIASTLTGDEAVATRMAALGPRIDTALRETAAASTERLRSLVDQNLSGGVLTSRTGTLRASLAGSARASGGISATLSATAPYAAFQEYGFRGTERVRAYLRRQSQVFGRPVSTRQVPVKSHSRRIDYAGRSFLGSAFESQAPDVTESFTAAVTEALSS